MPKNTKGAKRSTTTMVDAAEFAEFIKYRERQLHAKARSNKKDKGQRNRKKTRDQDDERGDGSESSESESEGERRRYRRGKRKRSHRDDMPSDELSEDRPSGKRRRCTDKKKDLIPKPEGTAGKGAESKHGGYTLKEELGLLDNEDRYLAMRAAVHDEIRVHRLVGKKRQQDPKVLALIYVAVEKKFPELQEYKNSWPVQDMITGILANRADYEKTKHIQCPKKAAQSRARRAAAKAAEVNECEDQSEEGLEDQSEEEAEVDELEDGEAKDQMSEDARDEEEGSNASTVVEKCPPPAKGKQIEAVALSKPRQSVQSKGKCSKVSSGQHSSKPKQVVYAPDSDNFDVPDPNDFNKFIKQKTKEHAAKAATDSISATKADRPHDPNISVPGQDFDLHLTFGPRDPTSDAEHVEEQPIADSEDSEEDSREEDSEEEARLQARIAELKSKCKSTTMKKVQMGGSATLPKGIMKPTQTPSTSGLKIVIPAPEARAPQSESHRKKMYTDKGSAEHDSGKKSGRRSTKKALQPIDV